MKPGYYDKERLVDTMNDQFISSLYDLEEDRKWDELFGRELSEERSDCRSGNPPLKPEEVEALSPYYRKEVVCLIGTVFGGEAKK